MDYAGSIYPTTMMCLACMVLWGCRDGRGLVSVFPADLVGARLISARTRNDPQSGGRGVVG